ncbi:MAG TPA: MFS transporter, partial [Rubrobacteraceae bacterium]|nr:MFS transporter [Rubrobacteraceae bacterium]
LLLLIPCVLLGVIVQNPQTPFWQFAVTAALGGLGGGNFASSMANISYFYPNHKKGAALGINAAGGNLGVGVVQFVVPVLIALGAFGTALGDSQTKTDPATGATSEVFVQNGGFFWVPLILLSAVCTYFFMNNLRVSQAPPKEQALVMKRKHAWIMSYLYIGTFGSFIGYSASFPLLIKTQFPENLALVFWAPLGPILGSLVRPIGGWLSDRFGGARITFWTFVVMIVAALGVLYLLKVGSFAGFLTMFLLLFVTTGIGNGSTYRMIPSIFRAEREREAGSSEGVKAEATRQGLKEAAFALGFAGAIAAYGGFIIPRAYGSSIDATGGPQGAFFAFIAFYVTCLAVTWWFYYRRDAKTPC